MAVQEDEQGTNHPSYKRGAGEAPARKRAINARASRSSDGVAQGVRQTSVTTPGLLPVRGRHRSCNSDGSRTTMTITRASTVRALAVLATGCPRRWGRLGLLARLGEGPDAGRLDVSAAVRREVGRCLPCPHARIADSRPGRGLDGGRSQAAISGAAQIGMSSRALTPDEAARVERDPVARDGMVIVVHPAHPSELTLAQVRAIYAGDLETGSGLGGRDAPITVITREEGSGNASGIRSAGDGRPADRGARAGRRTRRARCGRWWPPIRPRSATSRSAWSMPRSRRSARRRRRQRSDHRRREVPARPSLPVRRPGRPGARRARVHRLGHRARRAELTRREGLLPPAGS